MMKKMYLLLPIVSTSILLVFSIIIALEAAIIYFILFLFNLVIILLINSEYNMVSNNLILSSRTHIIISLFVSTVISFLTFSERSTIRFLYLGIGSIGLLVAIIYTHVLCKIVLDPEEEVNEIEYDEKSSKIVSKLILSNMITIISISLVYYLGIESVLALPLLWIPFFAISFLLFDRLSYAIQVENPMTRKEKILHFVYLILFLTSVGFTIMIRDFHGKPLVSPVEFILIFSLNLPYYLATEKKRKRLMK